MWCYKPRRCWKYYGQFTSQYCSQNNKLKTLGWPLHVRNMDAFHCTKQCSVKWSEHYKELGNGPSHLLLCSLSLCNGFYPFLSYCFIPDPLESWKDCNLFPTSMVSQQAAVQHFGISRRGIFNTNESSICLNLLLMLLNKTWQNPFITLRVLGERPPVMFLQLLPVIKPQSRDAIFKFNCYSI